MDVLDGARCRQLLTEALFADLAVISGGGPYVTPISFVRNGDALFFRSGRGERVDALLADPAACLSVVSFDEDSGAWASVIVRGDVVFVEDEETLADVVSLLLAKYRSYEPALGVALPELTSSAAVTFTLDLAGMSGRSSGSSLAPRTRPGRL
jgi:nitroimidazol reductase NimA-like FMN-containing flavoprotein (pyridoxamine 5'-phosphate oxidase superfamily)